MRPISFLARSDVWDYGVGSPTVGPTSSSARLQIFVHSLTFVCLFVILLNHIRYPFSNTTKISEYWLDLYIVVGCFEDLRRFSDISALSRLGSRI